MYAFMSKLANILKMLILLQSRGKMKVRELAEELEVNERMIRKYRDDLEQAGIYLTSAFGINGGYSLEDDCFAFHLKLNKEEHAALLMAREQLIKDNSFMFMKEYDEALDKINAALKVNVNDITKAESDYMIKDSKPNINIEKEKKKYIDINAAIVSRRKIYIEYFSLESGLKERIVCPYAKFMYKGFWYFVGYCQLRKEIREFKLSRIKKYEILPENFEPPDNFSLKDFMKNNIGIFNDEELKIKLKIRYPMSVIISERIWVENQKIKFNEDDKSILFEATMRGLPEIVSWILGMGSSVTIIEPPSLKNRVKDELGKMKEFI